MSLWLTIIQLIRLTANNYKELLIGHDCGVYVLQCDGASMLHFCRNKNTIKEFHPKIETNNSNAKRKDILQRFKQVADKRRSKIAIMCRYIDKNGSSYHGNDIDFHNELQAQPKSCNLILISN